MKPSIKTRFQQELQEWKQDSSYRNRPLTGTTFINPALTNNSRGANNLSRTIGTGPGLLNVNPDHSSAQTTPPLENRTAPGERSEKDNKGVKPHIK